MRSLWISGICGLLVVVTFVFCIPSVADALSHPTGYSFLYVMQLSVPNGVIVCVLLVLLGLVGEQYRFCSSDCKNYVNKNRNIPINAVLLTAAVSVLLSLINLGSSSAFYGIVTLGQAAQSLSYILAIASVLYRRIKSPETLPKARWSLGGYWRPVIINTLAITFSMNSFIWSFSPPTLPVTSTNFNPSGALFVGALVLMMATYFLRAKRLYVPPVARARDTPNWNLSHLSTGQNVQFLTIPEEF
ncbi:amino acid transporter [Aureobasidium pullulans]|uniref:Amino acid transporter n=1 Tax=Aureobasidium pullulans TaxID=5580 RepID=A0A4S9P0N7_AURPU|nr:amino acid transporter [Aureobasidium pullulans]THY62962.1 amino acid transporter [Aureobasidium pullulans]